MNPCESMNCGYYWQEEWEERPSCHYNDPWPAPCEYDEPADIDDDCGFDPYEGCYTYDY